MSATGRSTPFVGRQRELGALRERLEAAGRGEGGVVLVAGEPGIGKTRLLAELARADGWTVLGGRAYETEGMPPYLPFIEALRDYVRGCPDDTLRAQLGRGASEVALLVPELRERLPDLPAAPAVSPEAERYRLFESVADFLLAAHPSPQPPPLRGEGELSPADPGFGTEPSPPFPRMLAPAGRGEGGSGGLGVLLVLDDLHWADRPSLLLLLHLARRLAGARLLVAGAYRTVDLDRTHPLQDVLADLSREGLSARVLLAALAVEEVEALLAELTGVPAAPAVVEAIHRETEGNPFFVREVVRHLLAEGRDLTDPQAVPERWGIPEGVRQVIGKRLARLSDDANRTLQMAAVLGDGLTFDVLAAASGVAFAPLMDALDEALRAGILREEAETYDFTHALIRQTLHEGLNAPRRQWLHLRAADAIDNVHGRNLGPHLAELAVHYRLAGPAADPQKVIDLSQRAGAAAATVFAWEDAATHFHAALDLLDGWGGDGAPLNEQRRCDLLLSLAEAQQRLGYMPDMMEAFRRAAAVARGLGDSERLTRAALGFGEYRILPWHPHEQTALLEEALASLDEGDVTSKAQVLGLLAEIHAWTGERDRADIRSREAVALARQAGDPAILAYVLNERQHALWGLPQDDERLTLADEIIRLGETVPDPELVFKGHRWCMFNRFEVGDMASVDAEIEALDRMARRLRQSIYRSYIAIWKFTRALLAGRIEDAERHLHEVGNAWPGTGPSMLEGVAFQLFALRQEQGRVGELVAALENHPQRFSFWNGTLLAAIYIDLGREADARDEFERLAADDFVDLPMGVWGLDNVARLAETCAALGDTGRATLLYRLLLPNAGRNLLGYSCYGSASRYLGLLAATMSRWDEAARHFADAIALHDGMAARPLMAHARRDYASMLLKRGLREDRPRARELLEQALATYTDVGMEHYAAKTRALLAEPGIATARPAAPVYLDGLSEREVEVLRLIAAGKSNKEIGEALVISLNTVFRHVSHIFQKTGAANRAEAASYATRHGLLDDRR